MAGADSVQPSTISTRRARLGRIPVLIVVALGLWTGDVLGRDPVPALLPAAAAAAAVLLLIVSDAAGRRIALALLAGAWGLVAAARVYHPDFAADDLAAAPLHVPLWLESVVTADPEPSGARMRLWLAATQLDDGSGWHGVHGALLLTVAHAEHAWRAGDRLRGRIALRRPRNFGNPGEFDAEGYWSRRGVYVTGFVDSDADLEYTGHTGGDDWLTRWRRAVGTLFRETLPEPQAAVLSALIIGTQAAVPRELRAAFSRAGVSHVLSISGLHVALVAAAGYGLFRWLLARSRWLLLTANVPKCATLLSAIPVLLYAGIAGSNVATTRSVIMIMVFATAVLVDRQRDLLVSLALAAIVILLLSPGAARDISFQLSFAAVLGLLLAMQRFWPWWREWEERHLVRLRGWRARWWRPLAAYAVVSISALAATMPLGAFHFNQISLIAPVANAVVVPLLGSLAVGLGLGAAMLSAVSTSLARICVVLAGPCISLGLWCVELCAAMPYAALRVVTPNVFELALIYAGLLAFVGCSGARRVTAITLVALLLVADAAWWYGDRYHRDALRITFLSVGQGDSAVVELPGAEVMIVDGGGLGSEEFDVGERIIAPFLWSRKIGHVDYLVLSHPQWDHYGGFGFLAAHFSPREFWSNGTAAPSERFAHLQELLRQHGVDRVALQRGDARQLGAVVARIVAPPRQLDLASVNDQSLVVSLAFAGTRVLFAGDAEAPEEMDMVAQAGGDLASAVLKVPHHGSHTSSSPEFVDAVAPRLAVFSAGFENRYAFPHPEVLQRYAARQCAIARTDLEGATRLEIGRDGRITACVLRDVPTRSAGQPPAAAFRNVTLSPSATGVLMPCR